MYTAAYFIEKLGMTPHPEGGWFVETYRSADTIAALCLPQGFTGSRSTSTAIYFLLSGSQISALHKIKSDEVWHFYYGQSLIVEAIKPDGEYYSLQLGNNFEAGDTLQGVIPAGDWFGSRLLHASGFALVGCTVAPGFHFEDFEMADRDNLLADYPLHKDVIMRLTH